MTGVARRDHPKVAGRFGQGRRGLSLQNVAFQRFLLLTQRIIEFTCAAELIGPLRGVGGQPQCDAKTEAQRADDQHHERNSGQQSLRTQVDAGQSGDQPILQRHPYRFGRLGFTSLGPSLGLAGGLGPHRFLGGSGGRCGLWALSRPARLVRSPRGGAGARPAGLGSSVLSRPTRGTADPGLSRLLHHRGCGLAAGLHRLPFPGSGSVVRSTARSRTGALRALMAISSGPARSAPRVRATNSGP